MSGSKVTEGYGAGAVTGARRDALAMLGCDKPAPMQPRRHPQTHSTRAGKAPGRPHCDGMAATGGA